MLFLITPSIHRPLTVGLTLPWMVLFLLLSWLNILNLLLFHRTSAPPGVFPSAPAEQVCRCNTPHPRHYHQQPCKHTGPKDAAEGCLKLNLRRCLESDLHFTPPDQSKPCCWGHSAEQEHPSPSYHTHHHSPTTLRAEIMRRRCNLTFYPQRCG